VISVQRAGIIFYTPEPDTVITIPLPAPTVPSMGPDTGGGTSDL
jgi:hypothetical protein